MLKTRIATIGLSLALVLGVAATPAQAQTIAELQAQIQALMAQLAALQTGGTTATAGTNFTQNLTIGSTGSEVVALQQYLVAQGHLVMPAGVAYGYFGTLTQSAVAKWQAANGVSPASGYWGPISRAKAASLGVGVTTGGTVTTGTGTGVITTPGVEGTLTAVLSSEVSGAEVSEGDNKVEVMAIELEADISDIRVERIEIEFDTTEDEDIYRDFIDKIYVMHGSTVLASKDVNSSTVVEDSSGNLSMTITGLNFVVAEGEEEVITIAVDALSNIDSADLANDVTFTIPVDGIRGVDGAGLNQYAPSSAFSQDFDVVAITAGDLDISEADANPEAQVVSIDEDNNTDGVLVLAFELEADDQDITVDAIPVGLVSSDSTNGVDGAVRRAILKHGNNTLDTVSIPAAAGASYEVVFDNLDFEVEDGDTEEFHVYVDLNDADVTTFATGTTLYATTTGSAAAWDVEDASGDAVTPDGSVSNSGELLVFQTEGISATLISTSATKSSALGTNVTDEVGEFKIVFDVTAVGADMWVDKDTAADADRGGTGSAGTGAQWATTTQSTTGTTTVAQSLVASGSTGSDSATGYKINDGATRRFTLTVSLSADTNGQTAVMLTGINYDTDSTVSDSTKFYTTNLSDFKTDLLTLLSSD